MALLAWGEVWYIPINPYGQVRDVPINALGSTTLRYVALFAWIRREGPADYHCYYSSSYYLFLNFYFWTRFLDLSKFPLYVLLYLSSPSNHQAKAGGPSATFTLLFMVGWCGDEDADPPRRCRTVRCRVIAPQMLGHFPSAQGFGFKPNWFCVYFSSRYILLIRVTFIIGLGRNS